MTLECPKRQCRGTAKFDWETTTVLPVATKDDEPIAYLANKPLYLEPFNYEEEFQKAAEAVKGQVGHGTKRQCAGGAAGPSSTNTDERIVELVAEYYEEHQRERDSATHQHYRREVMEMLDLQASVYERWVHENYEEPYFSDRPMDYCS